MGSCQSSNVIRIPHEKRFRRAIKLYEIAEVERLMNVLNRNRCFESGDSPLTLAAHEGHEAVVQVLVDGGADVNRLDRNGRGPLHIAVQMNDVETVDVLLRASADPRLVDLNNQTAVQVACDRGYCVVLERLLRAAAARGTTAVGEGSSLTLAALRGHAECVRVLLEHGADPLARNGVGDSALRIAVANGDADSARALLERGALDDPADRVDPELGSLAAMSGRSAILEALVAAGYDVGRRDSSSASSADVPPPMIVAAAAVESVDCIGVLLRSGADPNARDRFGQSALHIAVMGVADAQKQPYFQRYFSNVYRQYAKYDVQKLSAENRIKCATSLIQSGADVSVVWTRYVQVFPGAAGDSMSFEQMVLCEVMVQAYGFVDIPGKRLRCFVRTLLNLRELGLVRLVYSAGVDPDWIDQSVLAMSWDETDKAMFRYIRRMCANPRTLKDLSRQRLRRHLSWNVLFLSQRLPLAENLRDYVCIIDTDCYSDVTVTSGDS